MQKHFNKIFWGQAFILFNLNFPFDLLPNFVGYGLILSALNGLVNQSFDEKVRSCFQKGIFPCYIMIGVSVITWITEPQIMNMDIFKQHIYLSVVGVLELFGILLMYCILKGINEISKINYWEDKISTSRNLWYVYLATSLVIMVYLPFNINITNKSLDGFMYFFTIFSFILNIGIMFFIRGVGKKFDLSKNLLDRKEDTKDEN